MKFCSRCGKEILEEAVICPGCGCAVEGEKKTVAPKQTYDQAIRGAASCTAISAVLLVLGIAVGLFVSILFGAVLCLAAEVVALLPNNKVKKLFKQNNGHITDKKERKSAEKALTKELKQKNGAYAFSYVIAVIALVGVIAFALLL